MSKAKGMPEGKGEQPYYLKGHRKGHEQGRPQKIKVIFESDVARLREAKVYYSKQGKDIVTYINLEFEEL